MASVFSPISCETLPSILRSQLLDGYDVNQIGDDQEKVEALIGVRPMRFELVRIEREKKQNLLYRCLRLYVHIFQNGHDLVSVFWITMVSSELNLLKVRKQIFLFNYYYKLSFGQTLALVGFPRASATFLNWQ